MHNESTLLHRLAMIRAKARRLLLAYGVVMVSAGGVVAFLTIAMLDWILWLPPVLRIFVACIYLVGFIGASYYWIARPLGAKLGLDEVAGRLEVRFPQLRDRLTSTVNFLQGETSGSDAMRDAVISRTETITSDMPLESALVFRPLAVRSGTLLASVLVLACIVWSSPGWARIGFYRYVYPWGEIEWPREVAIRPMTGDLTVAVGDSATVRMEIRRGLHEHLRGIVRLAENGKLRSSLTMVPSTDGMFEVTIDRVTKDLSYWFEAGDDSTRRFASKIHVVSRPEVVEAFASIQPPSYASDRNAVMHSFADGPARAPVGGAVTFTIRSGKPIVGEQTQSCLALTNDLGTRYPLVVDADDPRTLNARLAIDVNQTLRVELCDQYGFRNQGTDQYSILAVPDRPPVVTFLAPASLVELTPNGSIELLIQVHDDYGVNDLEIEVERSGRDPQITSLASAIRASDNESESRRTYRYTAQKTWSMKSESVQPGDLLSYHARAIDNYVGNDDQAHVGKSPTMSVRIISEAEFESRIRTDLALFENRIRESMLDQAELLDRTESLTKDDADLTASANREIVAGINASQTRLIRRMKDLSQRFRALITRMQQNQSDDRAWMRQMESMADSLMQTASGPMTESARALDEVYDLPGVEDRMAQLNRAAEEEGEAVDSLRSMLRIISQWGKQKEFMAKSRNLLDRQETIRRQTAQLGKSMLGLDPDALAPAQSAALKRVARDQGELGAEVEQLLQELRSTSANPESADPQQAERADAALRAARARDLSRQVKEAVDRVGSNRTAAAVIAQKGVSDGIRQMIAALLEKETRQLEELRKRLVDAMDLISDLIEQQVSLRDATHEAGMLGSDETVLADLVDHQRGLRRNTRQLGSELSAKERTILVGRLVTQAVEPMTRAEQYLREQQPVAAILDQEGALTHLQEALERLQTLADQASDEVFRRSLAQIRDSLEEIRAAQVEVNAGVGDLHTKLQEKRAGSDVPVRLGRRESRAATRLAREQSAVRLLVGEQKDDFEKVVVYRWALDRVAGWMETSQNQLSQRQIHAELVEVTTRIVNELDKLIQAIVDTQALPVDKQFVETASGSGGGASGQQGASVPVPTVAELLVLKSMQGEINQRTRALGQSIDLERAQESELRQLQVLGEDQAEVHRLSELLTQKAREAP